MNNLRQAPRKVRAVSDLIRGKNVVAALNQLDAMVKKPAPAISKLLKSAVASAEHTYDMVRDNLYVKSIVVDEGIKLRRYMPKAQGRAGEIQKKTSHISLVLAERVAGLKGGHKHEGEHKHDHALDSGAEREEHAEMDKKDTKRPEIKEELGRKTQSATPGIGRRMFRRKSI